MKEALPSSPVTKNVHAPSGLNAALLKLTLATSALITGCVKVENMHVQTPGKEAPQNVRAAESNDAPSNATVFKGTIAPSPKDQSVIIPEPGQSYDRLVGTGDRVEQGQILLRYADEVVERFRREFENRRVLADNAMKDVERLRKLRGSLAVSLQELEQAEVQNTLSNNAARGAEEKLEEITRVEAPRDGIVSVEASGVIKINGPEREVVTVVPMTVNPARAEVSIGELPPFPAELVMQEFVGADETSVRVTLRPIVPPDTELPIGSVDVRFIGDAQE